VPAMLLPQQPSARAARPVTPPSVPATPPPATHAATPAAYTPAPAPAAPAPYDHAAPEHDEDPSSKAPPGFTGEAIRAAESPTLLALDPVDDETTRPVAVVAPPETIGGSALLAKLLSLVPKRSDFKAFGGSRESTVRVALTVLVSALLVAFLLPAIGRALQDTPVVGTMVHQLQSLGLYPKAYGVPFIAAALSVISAMGILVAQMEKTAHEQERRDDPVVRLNIGLAALVAATLAAGAYTVLRSHGWAAGASAFGFFIGTCLLVPVANTPGARAMRHQPARAWALIFVLSAAGFAISPSIPGALIALLTFTHVRLNWGAVSRGDDDFRDGPIDATNRLSALLIMIVVLIATAVGTHAMTLSPDAVRQTYVNPDVSSQPELRGIDVGPSVKPPSNTP
jgi:MFS family permease